MLPPRRQLAEKIVILDFDGVLADTLDDILHFGELVCSRLGYPRKLTPDDLNALDRMEFAEIGRQIGLPEEKIDQFVQGNFELFNQRQRPPRLFNGMDEVVRRASANCKIGVVTGNAASVVWRFLETYDLTKYVDVVLGAEFAGSRVDKIRQAINSIDRKAGSRIFVVGDSVSDIRAAQAVPATSIAVGWGHQRPEKLALTQPDFFAATPQDLLAILAKN